MCQANSLTGELVLDGFDAVLDLVGGVGEVILDRGDGLVGWSSFGARVPRVDGAARLVLRDVSTGEVLVDRAVSAAARSAAS